MQNNLDSHGLLPHLKRFPRKHSATGEILRLFNLKTAQGLKQVITNHRVANWAMIIHIRKK